MTSKITLDQWEDISQRAISTFWQGAVASAPVTVAADWSAIQAGLLAMAVGGAAAATYLLLSRALRIPEVTAVLGLVRRGRGR